MNGRIKVGLVGCGYWGPKLARNFRDLPEQCELNMLCDANACSIDAMRCDHPDVEMTTDFGVVLNGANLDAIVIATPVHTHYPLAVRALKSGKHVFIEKPMADSSKNCEELIAIAEQKGLVLMVGHTFLYSPAVRRIKEIIESGEIGRVTSITADRLNLGNFQKDINVAWDLAPHDISIALSIMGDMPIAVSCTGFAHVTQGIEDLTTVSLEFSGGRSAIIKSSWRHPVKVRDTVIIGDKGMIVYNDVPTRLSEKIKIFDARVERVSRPGTLGFGYRYQRPSEARLATVSAEEPLNEVCRHFLDCIRHGKKPLSDGDQGLRVVRILEAATRSLREDGRMVRLDMEPRRYSLHHYEYAQTESPLVI